MKCSECGKEVAAIERVCINCQQPLRGNNVTSENDRVAVATSHLLANNHLQVSNIDQTDNATVTAVIDRTLVKHITLAGRPVTTLWLIIAGVIGFIGSWASVFSDVGNAWKFLFLTIIMLSMFLFLIGIILWKSRFLKLQWFNLESTNDGQMFVTKMAGNCPNCEGSLKLSKLRISANRSQTYVRCSQNSHHIWGFNFKVLD